MINREDFKGAIFDLDGTLFDSMWVWKDVDFKFLGNRQIEVPDDYMEAISPLGFIGAAKYTIERFNLTDTPEMLIAEWNEMAIGEYRNNVKLKKGAKEYLFYLKERGVKIAAATASHEDLFIPCLKNNGIYELFDNITTLQEVAREKGFPDIYLKAAEKMNLHPTQCVVFEDIYQGVYGASKGNFITVGVYDDSSAHEQERIKALANRYIMDFFEIISK